MSNRKLWTYDYETMINCFVGVFMDFDNNLVKCFVVNRERNDILDLINFFKENIKNKDYHLGFNCLNFDSQITEFILKNSDLLKTLNSNHITEFIYKYVQSIISRSNAGDFLDYPEYKLSIPVLDVYKMNHWDNAAKRSSLKWIQFSTDWENVEEMPHHHSEYINDDNTLNEIIEYCFNDVRSTYHVYKKCKSIVDLRKSLSKKYSIPCLNYSNTKIGSELLLKLYCEKTGLNKNHVKQLRTFRPSFSLNDVIFSYIKFNSKEYNDALNKFKSTMVIDGNLKGALSVNVKYKGTDTYYGLGGIHQCIKPGTYGSDDIFMILDIDVQGFYPRLAVVNKMYPEHLGPQFYEIYKTDIVDARSVEKNKGVLGDKAIVEGLKESGNASFGNSNSKFSWLYDPLYTAKTTVNGQLSLSMLVEKILDSLDSVQLIQTNTDGATIMLKRSDYDKCIELCKEWEVMTQLTLEYAEYSKMFILDVNSYIGLYTSGKTKCKGRLEWEEQENYKPSHLHKNKSSLIVPKAIYNYLINNIKPEDYLKSNRNIYDYCIGNKLKGNWFFEEHILDKGDYIKKTHKKLLRYYISNNGNKIMKCNPDGRQMQCESGYLQTIFNKYEKKPWEEYCINEEYYLKSIYEEIYKIDIKLSTEGHVQYELNL